jgi:hypothetical protein
MSIIPQPVTQNYNYQSLLTILSYNKSILTNGVIPKTDIFLRYSNKNYNVLADNSYKYTFVYNFDLNDFLNPTADSIKRAQVISHDQMSLNFGQNLTYFYGYKYIKERVYIPLRGVFTRIIRKKIYKTATVGYLYDLPSSTTTYSQEYGESGITLNYYMQSVIDALPGIVAECPVNMSEVQDFFPENYVTEYTYTDLQGNTTTKTASFTAIKYTLRNGDKKVLFFGTGLQEFIQEP